LYHRSESAILQEGFGVADFVEPSNLGIDVDIAVTDLGTRRSHRDNLSGCFVAGKVDPRAVARFVRNGEATLAAASIDVSTGFGSHRPMMAPSGMEETHQKSMM